MIDLEKEEQAAKLRGSLCEFSKFFIPYIENRDYIESRPTGRKSHQIEIFKALTKITRNETETQRLLINIPPRHGKSMFVCRGLSLILLH